MRSSSSEPNLRTRDKTRDIAAQILNPVGADREAEVLAGDVFDFVRFVEDDRVVVGQNASPSRRAAPPDRQRRGGG